MELTTFIMQITVHVAFKQKQDQTSKIDILQNCIQDIEQWMQLL